ncbi:MAG: tRNA 2-thiocytidine(32) synthetase TtcA [Candidatus Omnitrophica bacterium]|nr:tRNA 2-thiocytidine(32) synthetase TtcA [Candidatus Omnitrophota bacterium]
MMIKSAFDTKIRLRGAIRYVYKQSGKAISDYNMLSQGDRVLVAVSGGTDSLSLLKLLQMRQRHVPIDFHLVACFVDTDFLDIDRDLIEDFFRRLDLEYTIKELHFNGSKVNCFWCSWSRRKLLFAAAREHNCNKIALGHNLDDIAETTLMNLCFLGEVSTCLPNLEMFKGKIKIIRPLCYLSKQSILDFSSCFSFPRIRFDCPNSEKGIRKRIKELIQNLEQDYPYVKKNIFRSLKKIRKDYLL